MTFKTALLLSLLTLATLLGAYSVVEAWAVDSVERMEVYDVTCEKARKRFHEEARRQCVSEGNQLQSSIPKECKAVKDQYTGQERVVQSGNVKCTIRQ